ncbi:nesprin-4 isoform X3 [Pteropus medius]|uniref:nesprin-4 isoform X3 n=1 Tax=Pteropus vampyrus TaxID=132908 RepID=UPI00196AD2FF|nr:nesprin-4 isoform X3 [Pteropus giganteus]XP_039706126.1 nesprin-4 isoform X3 [Pteropus giganteus]
MALPPPLDPRPLSEPVNHPPGAPREVDIAGCTICLTSGEERIRLEWDQKLGQDSWNPPEHFPGGLKDTEPTAGCPKLPMPSFPEDPAGGKYCETPASGWEVLEAEQDSLHLCLLGLGLRLQHLERGPGPWTSAQSRMVHLQALQADLRGAAERIDALLAFGEGLAQRSEPQAWMSLQQVLRALGAHRESIFRRLRRLQAQLVSYSLVWPTLAVLSSVANFTTPMTSDLYLLSRCLRRPTHWTRIWRLKGTRTGQDLVGSVAPGHPVVSPLLQNWSGTQQGTLGALGPWGKRQPGHQGIPVSCVATGAPRVGDKALSIKAPWMPGLCLFPLPLCP